MTKMLRNARNAAQNATGTASRNERPGLSWICRTKRIGAFLAFLAFWTVTAFGQGVYNGQALTVTNGLLAPIQGAAINVCSGVYSGTACATATATVYSDQGLTNVLAQPLHADAQGNYKFWAAVGNYYLTVTGTGASPYTFTASIGGSTSGLVSGLTVGQVAIAGGPTSVTSSVALGSSANNIPRLDGNGGLSSVPILDKGGQLFNVKAYGAKGDGTTDDTSAINAAITAALAGTTGGTVFFPPGQYKITSGLVAVPTNGQGISFAGAGPSGGGPGFGPGYLGTSTIDVSGTDVIGLTIGSISTYNYGGSDVRNISFKEASAGTSAGAVRIINQSYSKIDHLSVLGFTKAGLAAPSAPTVSCGSGGSLSAGTYNVEVSYNNPEGETLPSSSNPATCSASGLITVTSPASSGNATTYNVYVSNGSNYILQNQSTGPTNLGTNATVSTQATSGEQTLYFDQSAGFGLKLFGTYGGYGVSTAYVNQPLITNFTTAGGPTNALIVSRNVSEPTVIGGNINRGTLASGCGAQVGGGSNIQTHVEQGGAGSADFCLSGFAGSGYFDFESPSSTSAIGIVAKSIYGWSIRGACSGFSASSPVTIDSPSFKNSLWLHSDTTCFSPMVADSGSRDTIYEDSNNSFLRIGGQLKQAPVAFTNAPTCNSGNEGSIQAITDDATTVAWGSTITGSGTNHVLGYCDGSAWTIMAK